MYKKEYIPNIQFQVIKQTFYLQVNLPKKLYRIQPHQKITFIPIILNLKILVKYQIFFFEK